MVFEYIEKEIFSLQCKSFTTDFEIALKNALKQIYGPSVSYRSCWFHFTQACKHNASKIKGFFEFVRTNPEYERTYYKFLCLPLLPPIEIPEAFLALKTIAFSYENEAVKAFVKYYERQWIVKVNYQM